MLYRLFTENKKKKQICQLVSNSFSGFTVFEAIGYWQGESEKSLCIEIYSTSANADVLINKVCRAICCLNKQDVVLLQKIKINAFLVNESGCIECGG